MNASISKRTCTLQVIYLVFAWMLLSPHQASIAAQQVTAGDFRNEEVSDDFAKGGTGKAINREMDKLKQVGFSGCVLVAHQGEIILVRSEGKRDDRRMIRPSTLFEIASVTKSFTATAAMILVQEGKLDLNASISQYLPAVPESSNKITVMNLLLHESGIPGDSYGDTSEDLETAVATMLAGGPRNEPGTKFEYWNQGYILLSEIISRAANQPFTDFVREKIFVPAGMTGTCFTGDQKPKGFLESIGTGKKGPPRSCLAHPYGKMELVYQGTGGIVSNVVDMWKFHQALLGNEILNEKHRTRMFETGVADFASGWKVGKTVNGSLKQYFSGSVRGFVCQFAIYPETDSCIVVLANHDQAPVDTVAKVIEAMLLQDAAGSPLEEKLERKIIGEYKDAKGRILIVFASGDADIPTQYMIYWDPKNPAAAISRGSVLQDESGNVLLHQPSQSDAVSLAFSDDKTKVESIDFSEIDMKFVRFDIKAWSK